MDAPVLLCTDGSDIAIRALSAGRTVLRPDAAVALVTVVSEGDPMMVTGTGLAGGVMTQAEFEAQDRAALATAESHLAATREALGLGDVPTHALRGEAGPAICELAHQLGASAIVIGTRGRSGLKRAVLGSVSDHVVRNAPCPVVVTSPTDEA